MLASTDLAAIAAQMKGAQHAGHQIPPFSSRYQGFDIDSAYAVADELHRARVKAAQVSVGRKIGFTNPDMWPLFNVGAPVWAYVYESTVVQLGRGRQTCSLGSFCEPKIEPEIILHFKEAPPVAGDAQAILRCVDWISHGFEIVQCHFPGWQFKAPDTIADLALHATLLVGKRVKVDQLGSNPAQQLEQFSIELSCNAACREIGRGFNVLGSPLLAVAHLTKVLASQPDSLPIQAGEIVTTGTITKAYSIQVGEVWTTTVGGISLPGLSIEFTT
jgi:2-keto-4-pentenoate hydratase